jgi:hypothetical protein
MAEYNIGFVEEWAGRDLSPHHSGDITLFLPANSLFF